MPITHRLSVWLGRLSVGRKLMLIYLLVRQATSALGLTSLGGHPQMVRPLIAPMAEGAAAPAPRASRGPRAGSNRFSRGAEPPSRRAGAASSTRRLWSA